MKYRLKAIPDLIPPRDSIPLYITSFQSSPVRICRINGYINANDNCIFMPNKIHHNLGENPVQTKYKAVTRWPQ